MREIKFRAWDDILETMHDWEYLRGWTFKDIQSGRGVVATTAPRDPLSEGAGGRAAKR